MKQIKSLLLISFLVLIGLNSIGQASLTFRFNNFMVVPGAVNDTLIFDVEAKCDVGTTYLTQVGMVISFSETAFGSGALPVSVQRLALTLPSGYNFNTPAAPAATNRFSSSFSAFTFFPPFSGTYQTAFLSNVTTDYQGLARYKMLITGAGPVGVAFYEAGMNGQQFYVLTSGGTIGTAYAPIVYANTLANLPATPTVTDLLISEIGNPASGANFVEIYNAGDYDVDFDIYPWFLSVDNGGIVSAQLTGTILAGGTFVVAQDGGNFNTAYPGKSYDQVAAIIGTGGTFPHYLSTFGDYNNGNPIDVFTENFTGKHAVRHYSVMMPNTTFTASEWVISDGDDMDMTPGSHRTDLTWDGSSTSEWHNQGNWATAYIPDAGHNVVIPNGGETVPVISNGDNAYCNDLTIGGSTVGLIIASDVVDGDGSLITYGTVTGTASVQRYLGADRYWYVSQPVMSATAGVFLHTWMFTYNEPAGNWDPYIEPEATPMNLMQGYAVWTSSVNSYYPGVIPPIGDTTVAYEGVLNTGDQNASLTYTVDGWNFAGNPYPSAVDWESADWTKTNLATNSYSVWDGSTYGTYTAGSGGTNGTTQFIPAAQGFFVQTSAAGSLGVTNATRAHSTQSFWKNQENMMDRLSLTLSNGEINDETVIYFNANATTGLDYDYDAAKLIAPAAPQAFTMLGEEKMAINTFNNPGETAEVTMGINAPEAGEYTITASNIESFDASMPIFLEDLLTNTYVNLRETSSYSFSSEEGISGRFVVHFSNTQGIDDPATSEVNSIYAYNKDVYVNFNGTNGEISIYNLLGQEISRNVASNGMNILSVPQGNTVYIVKVVSENVNVTKKVFVK